MTLEELKVVISAETKDFKKQLNGISKEVRDLASNINKDTSAMSGSFNEFGKTVLNIGKKVLGAKAIFDFSKEAISLASNLEEAQNVVNVAFGDMAYEVEEFAETALYTFGMTAVQAKQFASNFQAISNSMGIVTEDGKNMSLSLTRLAGDLASFYNTTQDQAFTALQGVFTGESEALKKYGITMTEAALKEHAFALGIQKSYSAMSQSEKVALRYSYVMEKSAQAQGDFARSSDSWANQMRMLKGHLQEIMTSLGQILTHVLLPIVKVINTILGAISIAAKAFAQMLGAEIQIGGATEGISSGAEAISDGFSDSADSIKEMKKQLAGFDELNNLSKDTGTGSGLGGIGGGFNIDIPEYDDPGLNIFSEETMETIKDSASEIMFLLGTAGIGGALKWFKLSWKTAFSVGGLIMGVTTTLGGLKSYMEDPTWESFGNTILGVGESLFSVGLKTGNVPLMIAGGISVGISELLKHKEDIINWGNGVITDLRAKNTDWSNLGADWIEGLLHAFDLGTNGLKKVFDGIIQIFQGDIEGGIKNITDGLGDVAKSLYDTLVVTINSAWEAIKLAFEPVVTWLSAKWDGFTDGFGKACNSLADIWRKCLTTIKNVIKPLLNPIIDIFNGFIKGIANGINGLINLINKIQITIPSWVPGYGGKSYKPNLKTFTPPQIPRLNVGTNYVPQDMLAMLHKGEAVVPKEFNEQSFFGGQETNMLLRELINVVSSKEFAAYISKKEVGQAAVSYINSQQRILGGALL